jgi:hypothetical protein
VEPGRDLSSDVARRAGFDAWTFALCLDVRALFRVFSI